MREIKFRAWNVPSCGGKEHYIYWDNLLSFPVNTVFNNRGLILEQYTGLKDKNGTEIYEGDITHIGRYCKIPREIIYSGSGFFVRRLNRKPNVIYDMTLMCECPSITIIGNIHENPELLT